MGSGVRCCQDKVSGQHRKEDRRAERGLCHMFEKLLIRQNTPIFRFFLNFAQSMFFKLIKGDLIAFLKNLLKVRTVIEIIICSSGFDTPSKDTWLSVVDRNNIKGMKYRKLK